MAADGNKVGEVVGEKSNMITLISSDNQHFEITHAAAVLSQTISHMIEDDCVENGVPLENVKSSILAKVIEYCNKHAAAAAAAAAGGSSSADTITASGSSDNNANAPSEQDLKTFDAEFINVDQATLYDLILAANYMDIKGLLELCCQTVADMIKGKTPEQIRATFNIKNDFTPEEEEEIRKENSWAFDN